jgi:hypothetical protein
MLGSVTGRYCSRPPYLKELGVELVPLEDAARREDQALDQNLGERGRNHLVQLGKVIVPAVQRALRAALLDDLRAPRLRLKVSSAPSHNRKKDTQSFVAIGQPRTRRYKANGGDD